MKIKAIDTIYMNVITKRKHSEVHGRLATIRQVRAVEELIKGKGKNIGAALIAAGYSKSVARSPEIVTDSKGYKKMLHASGLTHELVATSLTEDIIGKPKRRVQELNLAADILGMKGEKAKQNDFIPVRITVKQLNVISTEKQHPEHREHTETHATRPLIASQMHDNTQGDTSIK